MILVSKQVNYQCPTSLQALKGYKRVLAYLKWKLLEDEFGGFIVDIFKGSPAPQNGLPYASATGQEDWDRIRRAVELSQKLAVDAQNPATAGMHAQEDLLKRTMDMASGVGPNPAESALTRATGQNVANTAAQIAGSGINPALAARSIATTGANIQQGSAADAARLMAEQQIAARQAAGSLSTNMVAQGQQAANSANAATAQPLNMAIQNAGNMGNQAQQGYSSSANLFGSLASSGSKMMGAADGGKIPGDAPVPGDSEENDIVPVMLSPGEIVVPRSYASDPKSAAAFAHAVALMSKRGKK